LVAVYFFGATLYIPRTVLTCSDQLSTVGSSFRRPVMRVLRCQDNRT